MPRTRIGTPTARIVRSSFLFVLVVGVALTAARSAERWTGYPASLDEVLARFPAREANRTALDVEKLAAAIGADLVPKAVKDERRTRPEPDAGRAFFEIRNGMDEYLKRVLGSPSAGSDEPPPALTAFLAARGPEIAALRERLLRGDSPRWERDVSKGYDTPLPNLLGLLWLQRLLVADALARSHAGDPETALADLEACWTLNESLREDPILIDQLVAVAIARWPVGALRHVAGVPAEWVLRLREHDFRESMTAALGLEGWRWTQSDVPPGAEDASGLLHRFAQVVKQPYFRMCLDETAEAWRLHLASLSEAPSLCEVDLEFRQRELLDSIPWWNGLAKDLVGQFEGSLARVARLEVDLELTARVIEAEAALRAGAPLPVSVPGMDASSACPSSAWRYGRGEGGGISIALDRSFEWPGQLGVILPTRYVGGFRTRSD